MIPPTAHGTVSHMPSHFDSPVVFLVVDTLGGSGGAVHAVVDDADSCCGYSAVAMRRRAEAACPRTYSPSLVTRNAFRETPVDVWGVRPPAS